MKRRIFIRNLGLLATGFMVGCNKKAYPGVSDTQLLRGRVRAAGKGVEGVVISDGYSVVATNSKGWYEFSLHPQATTIFMSTPAGYAFNTEKHISRHYYLVTDIGKRSSVDFELTPLAKDDTNHQFVIWADPQVKNMKDVEKMMTQSVPHTRQWIGKAGSDNLLHGICVGDIVWDNHALFAEYDKAVEKMGIPFFQCLGNHDMDYTNSTDDTSDDTFQKTYGPTDYSFNRGKVHYVVMDNVRYLGKDREYDGYFAQRQLDWLAKDLSFVPQDHLVILNVHIPVHNGVKNKAELYAVLGDRNVHIMSGHTHYHRNVITGNIFEHNHGTVCGAWWTGPICVDGTPCGYGTYAVNGTKLSWVYQSTGQEQDHQLSLYLGDEEAGSRNLTVNIWNHDPEWKTEYLVDGVSKGSLEQFVGFDPVAYKNMIGPDLPKPRGFAEPHQTDHLFKALVPQGAKELTVRATDRFGATYSATKYIA